jgi:Leucine-rich repeat (LRR) protein
MVSIDVEIERRIAEVDASYKASSTSSSSAHAHAHAELLLDHLNLVDVPMSVVLNVLQQGICIHLTALHLNCNQIVALPSAIGQIVALEELNIESNLLTTLPKEIGCLTSLNRLHAFDNKIGMRQRVFDLLRSCCKRSNSMVLIALNVLFGSEIA